MQNPSWMDRISAMTAGSKNSFLSPRLPNWKISIADVYRENCTWDIIKSIIVHHPFDDYIVWYRESKGQPWERVVSTHIASVCSCGREWENVNGVAFSYRGEFNSKQYSREAMLEWLNAPLQCRFCFYSKQHANGEWAPRDVIKELES